MIAGDRIPANLIEALHAKSRVSGLTHDFYRYPARFSPLFVRAAIQAFSSPGDLVVDPFMGGGTTPVEALSLGRRVLGSDLNRLSVFVARAKTTPLTAQQADALLSWAERFAEVSATDWHTKEEGSPEVDLPWVIRKTLSLGLASLKELGDRAVAKVARATLLRTGQWALDGRREIPSKAEFMAKHKSYARSMAAAAVNFGSTATGAFGVTNLRDLAQYRRVLWSPAEELASAVSGQNVQKPRLVLTSPPYHGVHILYHRWQVRGRRETSAPYWIAGTSDGQPASYYTFGSRARRIDEERPEYFQRALSSFKGIASLCSKQTVVAQLVGFSNPVTQLPRYLAMLKEAGLHEMDVRIADADSGLERVVPNRKWYMDALGRDAATSREFLLLHRRKS